MTAPVTAALYVRVSTADQTAENQLQELQRLADARGYIAAIYSETESAAKRRPVFEAMIADVKTGRVGAVLVWALDRLHRSMTGALATILECDRLGVPVISLRENWLDTTGPVRPLLIAIFGWVAEQERTRLIERTKAGLARARAQGKRLGRPPASPLAVAAAVRRVRAGTSIRDAAKAAGVNRETVRRAVRE